MREEEHAGCEERRARYRDEEQTALDVPLSIVCGPRGLKRRVRNGARHTQRCAGGPYGVSMDEVSTAPKSRSRGTRLQLWEAGVMGIKQSESGKQEAVTIDNLVEEVRGEGRGLHPS